MGGIWAVPVGWTRSRAEIPRRAKRGGTGSGGWIVEGEGVSDVVEEGTGDGEVGGLGGEVVASGGGSGSGGDDEGVYRHELEDVGRARRGDERQGDVEGGLGGDEVCPT